MPINRFLEADVSTETFRQFEARAKVDGFDEVLERRWPAHTTLETHSHPFDVRALVVDGQLWLTVGKHTRHLRAGDDFELDRDVAHAERYGVEGTTYWVARRHPKT